MHEKKKIFFSLFSDPENFTSSGCSCSKKGIFLENRIHKK